MAKLVHLASNIPACCHAKGVPMTFTFCIQNVTCKKCAERWNNLLANHTDFVVEDHGTVWKITAHGETACGFTESELGLESWQVLTNQTPEYIAFAVDHRLAAALVGSLIDEGFTVRNRFLEPLRVLDDRTIVAGTER